MTSIKDWIKKSLQIYIKRENLVYLTKFALVGLLPQAILFLVSFIVISPALDPDTEQFNPQQIGPFLGIFILTMIIFVVISVWIYIAMIKAVGQVLEGKMIGVKETLKASLSKILPIFGVFILTGIVVGIGVILLIIPGIIFGVWFYFAQYVLVIENVGVIAAMKRSRELVKGYFWPVVGRGLIIILYTWLISLAVSLTLFPVVQMVILGLITPYFYLLPYLVYRDLKTIKATVTENQGNASVE